MLCAWLISMAHCFRLFTFNSVRYNKWTPTTIPTLLVTGYSKYTYVHDCDVSFDAKIYVCCKLCVLLQRCTKTRRWTCRTTRASWPSRPASATTRGTSSRHLRQRQYYSLQFSLNLLHFSWAVCLWDQVMYSYRLQNVFKFHNVLIRNVCCTMHKHHSQRSNAGTWYSLTMVMHSTTAARSCIKFVNRVRTYLCVYIYQIIVF